MANYKKVVAPGESESKEPDAPAIELAAPKAKSVDAKKSIVCVGGYNHSAVQSGDTLEIASVGLPLDFSMVGVLNGYFPGEVKKRFNISSHTLDKKSLLVKIAPHT